MPTTPLNIRLEEEAERLLREWSPNGRHIGRVVERLVYSERDRREMRTRTRQRVLAALKNDEDVA